MINKSLDDIDAIISNLKADPLKKSVGDEGVNPEEVSNDTPPEEETQEGNPEEGAAEEGTEEGAEEGNPEEGAPEDTDNEEEEEAQKSLESTLNSNESVRKALEVSEFLSELVKSISTTIDGHNAELNKSLVATNQTHDMLAKSFQGIAKAQKAILEMQVGLNKSMQTIEGRLTKIEGQPQMRKSVPSAKALDKSFNASASLNNKPNNGGTTLTKSQASAKLTEAFHAGDSSVMNDILALEGTGSMDAISAHGREVLGIK
jgi:hypothetical protein